MYGFPYGLCCSVNEVIVHGFPSEDVILKEGDIVSFDVGTVYEGFYGDAARTLPWGMFPPRRPLAAGDGRKSRPGCGRSEIR